mgnify:CR=1 FL=1
MTKKHIFLTGIVIIILSIIFINKEEKSIPSNENSSIIQNPIEIKSIPIKTDSLELPIEEITIPSNYTTKNELNKRKNKKEFNKNINKELEEIHLKKQEAYIKRMKEKEKIDKYESVTENTIEYSNFEAKRVTPFEFISEVPWDIDNDQYIYNAISSPKFDSSSEERIERISIKDIKSIFIGVEKGLINEIEMPTNGSYYIYNNCTMVHEYRFSCSDVNSSLSIYMIDNKIEIRHRSHKNGKFVGKLINNQGYNFDISNNGVITW